MSDDAPAVLMNRDFKRFMRELRDKLSENGIYVDRIRAIVAEGFVVTVYSDAIIVELDWKGGIRRIVERL